VRERLIAPPAGGSGIVPRKIPKLFKFECVFKLISQLTLNTDERSYSGLLICGNIRGCKRPLLNVSTFVMFEAPESLYVDY
jgi:hypothetical protein